ncbi:MAG: ECF transporter S component [Miniphocaeibacter sp.]|uniref:ECF transporter S component n=1 Tax=Miniphocaeibacter sp. TaxID=3100973 RepID=UPI0017AF1F7F|nr:ECF transporter S component [Gallicola sp.]
MSSRKLTFLSLLSAATIAGRIFFQFLPNIQPVTSIIIFTAIYFSFIDAILLNILVIFISNLYLGFGIWTIYQIVSYGIIILIASILKNFKKFKTSILLQSIYCLFSGFIFGFVYSLLISSMFASLKSYWVYLLADIPFNLLHGIGNFVIYLIIVPILLNITKKYFN